MKNVGRDMVIKGNSEEISYKNEELCYWKLGKGGPCYKVAKNMAELYVIRCFVENKF